MRKIIIILFVFFIFTGCKQQALKLPDLTKDEITAEKLWNRFTKETNYKKYPMWPGHEGLRPGVSPHGRFHAIYINHKLRDALPIASKIAPVGSMIVKENYTSDKELVMYTVMTKVDGYNPDHNDWFWAKYDQDGNVQVEGKLDKCASCHASRANDYVIIRKLDKPLEE